MTEPRWQRWIRGLREGDEAIAGEFYAHYGPLLEGLANRHVEAAMRRRFGPNEVAHSVCRTFLRRVRRGDFEFDREDRVWHLLCAMTLAKTRKKAGHHLAAKRALRREQTDSPGAADDPSPAWDSPDLAPTPAESAEFTDALDHLLADLDDEEKRVVCLKLEQRDNHEIAATLGCSERTVRRLLQRLEERLGQQAETDLD